jgi:hypothetical protein
MNEPASSVDLDDRTRLLEELREVLGEEEFERAADRLREAVAENATDLRFVLNQLRRRLENPEREPVRSRIGWLWNGWLEATGKKARSRRVNSDRWIVDGAEGGAR